MLAVLKRDRGPGAEIIEMTEPEPGPGEVLVQVLATSICGTDVHIYRWDPWAAGRIRPPMVFGHEFAGRVVAVGPGVGSHAVGDLVSAETHIPCGNCLQCLTGDMHLCANLRIVGVDTQGCFAGYAVVPAICAWKNAAELPPELASIQEPLGNAVHTVQSCDVRGRTVLILGDGPIGIMTIPIARKYGARRVIVAGLQAYRMEVAARFAPDLLLDVAHDDIVARVQTATNGIGADVVLEMSGAEGAIATGLKAVRRAGEFAAFGIPGERVKIDWAEGLIFKGVTLRAINGRRMFDTWFKTAALLADRSFDISPVITHRMRLAEFHQAQALLAPGEARACKIVLSP